MTDDLREVHLNGPRGHIKKETKDAGEKSLAVAPRIVQWFRRFFKRP